MDIASVNALSYEDFVDAFGNVVERCPIVTAAVWSRRPFVTFSDLAAAISEFIDALPHSGESSLQDDRAQQQVSSCNFFFLSGKLRHGVFELFFFCVCARAYFLAKFCVK